MNAAKTFWIILLSGFFITALPATAQQDHASVLELLGEMAEKPEHHQAIAEHYKSMAENARSEAEKHDQMRNAYKHSHARLKGRPASRATDRHCKRLVDLNRSLAKEYDALAELHENEANQ